MRRDYCIRALAAVLLAGCTVGPNYQRPQMATPAQFRAPGAAAAQRPASLWPI